MPLPKRLYIMHCRGTTFYKIGISWAAELRVRDIRRAVQSPVDVVAEFKVPNARAEERALHRRYAACRIRLGAGNGCTEWFNLPHAEAGALVLLLTLAFSSAAQFKEFMRQLSAILNPYPWLLTKAQAVELSGLPVTWIEQATRGDSPKLRHIGRGRGWRVHRDELLAFAESFRDGGDS